MRKQKAPVDALRDKQRVHGLELREPLLHLVGNLPNANLEIAISFGLVIDDLPLSSGAECPLNEKCGWFKIQLTWIL